MQHLQMIPVQDIDIEGNPRTKIDDDAFAQLVDSIRQHGVITPITVSTADGGRWKLIAGQRRVLAARELGLTEIPTLVRDVLEGSEIVEGADGTPTTRTMLAVSENLHRDQLAPSDEARAFKEAGDAGMSIEDIAATYSVSDTYVRRRLVLLGIPEQAQDLVDTGAVPLKAVPRLAAVAAHMPAVADAMAAAVAEGQIHDGALTNMGHAMRAAVERLGSEAPFMFEVHSASPPEIDSLTLTAEKRARYEEALSSWSPYHYGSLLTEGDVDNARAFGVLLEVENERAAWITDPAFVGDYILPRMEEVVAKQAERAEEQRERAGKPKKLADMDETERAQHEEQKQADRQARLDALARNEALGAALFEKLAEPAIDLASMKLVAELIFHEIGAELFISGLRFTPQLKTVTPASREGGMPKVTTIETHEGAQEQLERLLKKAKTPEAVMGLILQLVIASVYIDQTEAPQSKRRPSPIHGFDSWSSPDDWPVAKLVEKVARKILPPVVKAELKRRAEAKAKKRETVGV